MRKMGSLEPVIYFVNHEDSRRPKGYIVLAPYSAYPTPRGHSREEASTLVEVDRLQKLLQEQERRTAEADYYFEEALFADRKKAVFDRLQARMVSSATSEYEKEFIRLWLMLKDEQKRERYRREFENRMFYLWAREMDSAKNRPADVERADIDRIG